MKKKIILTFMVLSLSALTFGCGEKVDDGNTYTTKDDVSTEASTAQTAGQTTEQTTGLETEVTTEQSTEQEEDDYNPNGYGFSIGQDCLKVYLDYVSDGRAEDDYKIQEDKNVGEGWGHKLAYFSIAGMAGDEPFLLLSSASGNGCGDETYFVTYTPYDYSGEGIDQIHMQGNWDIENSDMWSMSQHPVINTLYVYTSGRVEYREFVFRLEVEYSGQEGRDVLGMQELKYRKGKMTNSKTSLNFEEMLETREIAEIKWFSIDEIEEARAYYQQYVREEVYDGPVESANRDDYFNDSTVLKYFDYISEGVFEVSEDADGDKEYRFSCLEFEQALEIMQSDVDNALTFTAGSDSQNIDYYLLENDDGSWTYIKRHWCRDGYGDIITYSYETNESQIVFWYNQRGAFESVDSIETVIKELKEQ